MVDGTEVVSIEWDHCVTRDEWNAAVFRVREAGASWARFIRLEQASAADFDAIDQEKRGYLDFRSFCEWIEAAEKLAGTSAGLDLGVKLAPPPLEMLVEMSVVDRDRLREGRGVGGEHVSMPTPAERAPPSPESDKAPSPKLSE